MIGVDWSWLEDVCKEARNRLLALLIAAAALGALLVLAGCAT